jgi:hypothetical protein
VHNFGISGVRASLCASKCSLTVYHIHTLWTRSLFNFALRCKNASVIKLAPCYEYVWVRGGRAPRILNWTPDEDEWSASRRLTPEETAPGACWIGLHAVAESDNPSLSLSLMQHGLRCCINASGLLKYCCISFLRSVILFSIYGWNTDISTPPPRSADSLIAICTCFRSDRFHSIITSLFLISFEATFLRPLLNPEVILFGPP